MKAFLAVGKSAKMADEITSYVVNILDSKYKNQIPSVEDIQDEVERALVFFKEVEVAKAYILYREERSKVRS